MACQVFLSHQQIKILAKFTTDIGVINLNETFFQYLVPDLEK